MDGENFESIEISEGENEVVQPNAAPSPASSTPGASKDPQPTQAPPSKPPKPQVSKSTSGRKRSWVWDHFTKLDGVEERAACNYCSMSYTCSTKLNGTSSMACHLENKCKKYPYRKQEKGQTTLSFQSSSKEGEGSSLVPVSWSVKACRKALTEMVIIDELPFNFVERDGFKRFIRVVCPRWDNIPSRFTLQKDCLHLYTEERNKLKNSLKGQRVCLTTDTWTSIQNMNYMCLTAHFIDRDWKLHKRILNFCIVDSHKGEELGKVVEMCLLGWGIEKILTITVDNASANNLLVSFLKKKTKGRKSCILGHDFLHIRCCAHILNLVVCEGLKEYNESITKVRNAVRYVRSSPHRLTTFKLCAEKEGLDYGGLGGGLCLDVPTRWNSTYLMLEKAEKYQKAFERLEEEDGNFLSAMGSFGGSDDGNGGGRDRRRLLGPLENSDWETVRMFVNFLKLFYDATLRFSGSLQVTINTFYAELELIRYEINQLCISSETSLSTMALGMKSKFDKYWGSIDNMNLFLFIGVVIDPRYKLKYVKVCLEETFEADKVKEMTKKVKVGLTRLFEWYLTNEGGGAVIEGPSASQETISTTQDASRLRRQDHFLRRLAEEDIVGSQNEVEKYLGESCEPVTNEKFDILGWWKHNSSRFKVLSKVARDILAIPVSTVASESAFSTGGRVLDSFRSSLAPTTVEALICAQNWIRDTSSPISLQDAMDSVEELEHALSESILTDVEPLSHDY